MMILSGIKVLELAVWVAAPSASMILADWGAEVIKIENPKGGDAVRGLTHTSGVYMEPGFNQLWELLNRNKKSIALNIKNERAREIIYKLVKNADVFTTNYRQQTLQKLGYDYETISRVNPRIIYASVTGYGLNGPSKGLPGMDETAYWARSGIMSVLGEPDSPPPPLHGALGDLPTGMFLAGGIAAALFRREKTGIGQEIEASLLSAGIWTAGIDVQTAIHYHTDAPRESRKEKLNALYNSYQTKEGRWIMLAMPQSDIYWPNFCRAIDREDLVTDPRFNSSVTREKNKKLLISLLDEIIGDMTLPELKERFDKADIVWSLVQTMTEVVADPDAIANGYIIEYDHPGRGKIKGISTPIQFRTTPASVRTSAPELGQHTEEVLLELGYTWTRIGELKEKGVIL